MARKFNGDSMVLMEEFIKTVKAIGGKNTIEVLKELRNVESSSIIKIKKDIIINEVLADFNVSLPMLISKKSHTFERKHARRFIYVLLKRHLQYDHIQIASMFKRSNMTVWSEIAAFDKLNAKLVHEAELLQRFTKIEKVVVERIS